MDLFRKFKSKNLAPSIAEEIVVIYLYGSSITERLTEESDIDIAILPSHNGTGEERLILISKIEDIFSKILKEKGIGKRCRFKESVLKKIFFVKR